MRAAVLVSLLSCIVACGGIAVVLYRFETRLTTVRADIGNVIARADKVANSVSALSDRVEVLPGRIEHLSDEIRFSAPADLGHKHTDVRQFVITSNLAQVDAPIVFVGDSITETARLPTSICGHPVVNAGVGGASSSSYLALGKPVLGAINSPLIVVALGTNDSQIGARNASSFAGSYTRLIEFLKSRANALVLVGVPPLEMSGALAAGYFDEAAAGRNDAVIEAVAASNAAQFADLRSMMKGTHLTVDGVHLTREGYAEWMAAISAAIATALDCQIKAH